MKPSQSKKSNKAMKLKVVEAKVVPKKNKHSHPQNKNKTKVTGSLKRCRKLNKKAGKMRRKGEEFHEMATIKAARRQ